MRRHNRSNGHGQSTFNTKATSEPKWEDLGHGILQLKGTNTHIMRQGKKWRSLPDKAVKFAICAPANTFNA